MSPRLTHKSLERQCGEIEEENSNVHVATVTVVGSIGGDDPHYSPHLIAAEYWKLFNQQKGVNLKLK